MSAWRHVWWSIRYGDWSIGFASQKQWPGKPRFAWVTAYYDGHHWALHLGAFYLGCSYY